MKTPRKIAQDQLTRPQRWDTTPPEQTSVYNSPKSIQKQELVDSEYTEDPGQKPGEWCDIHRGLTSVCGCSPEPEGTDTNVATPPQDSGSFEKELERLLELLKKDYITTVDRINNPQVEDTRADLEPSVNLTVDVWLKPKLLAAHTADLQRVRREERRQAVVDVCSKIRNDLSVMKKHPQAFFLEGEIIPVIDQAYNIYAALDHKEEQK